MAHQITIVDAPSAGTAGVAPATAEEITELEELWKFFLANPGKQGFWNGDSAEAMADYKKRANGYLRNRPEGALNLRQVRRQNLPANQMRFVIAPYTKGDE